MANRSLAVAVTALGIVALGSGCNDKPPKGPDLVACTCSCETHTSQGTSAGSCNPNQCDPPCPIGQSCAGPGRCEPFCATTPPPPPTTDFAGLGTVHVCVDSSNTGNVIAACQDRCDAFASGQGSAVTCAAAVLEELGLKDVVPESIKADIATEVNPATAQTLTDLIFSDCGTLLTDTLTGTCGLSTTGTGALVDLFSCVFSPLTLSPNYPAMIRTCTLASLPSGNNPFRVEQLNGCPQFKPTQTAAGPVAHNDLAGSPFPPPTTAMVSTQASAISIAGPDVSAGMSHPSGTVSSGRVGPILFLTQLDVTLPDGQLSVQGNDVTLTGGFMKLSAPVAALLTPGPIYTIPPGKLKVIVTGFLNGDITSVEAVNTDAVSGLYDEEGGFFDLSGQLALQGLNATVQMQLTFAYVNRAPIANAGPDQTVECNLPSRAAAVSLSADSSFDPDPSDQIVHYTWTVAKELVADGPGASHATAAVGLGKRLAMLTTVDSHGSISRDSAFITVVDTKAPVFPPLPPLTNSLCVPDSQPARIPTPAVTDACGPGFTVTGAVISSNGQPLATPIPIQNGQVQLPVGTHVVRWTATDQSGNAATATQTVNVRPGVLASNSISVEDRAQVKVAGGGFAALANGGSGTVNGVQAQTGSIVTRGDVFLRDRTIVNGNVFAGGTITTQNLVTVTGRATQHASVTIPAGRDLAGVVFPTTNAGPVTMQNGASRALAPGAYGAVTVNAGSTLSLRTGTYTFTSLDLEPQARLTLDQGGGPVQLYVRSSIIDRGQIATTAGDAAGFVLGYAGTGSFVVESPFPGGTVIAPSGAVVIGSLGASAFAGQLYARDIQIRPDATLTCTGVPGATP